MTDRAEYHETIYRELRKEQGGRCAICGRTEEESGRRLAIDHDHTTERVRGALCNSCNTGLGFFGDNIRALQKAIEYLSRDTALRPYYRFETWLYFERQKSFGSDRYEMPKNASLNQ